ncbi:hypothetical protein [Xylophilus sp. GOD-11R]|uniref:toxin-antitoxin system YwqK family antitoxin n=1 Tax=Xylophilus sp. GOD-11R TaxID=3089814 RepID=UPI00298D2118|nr:hypothetical protein [Xylophilus sp. GOD-11R]WPB56730.1 hypothetical protein R9X41_21740 [Xylophilus sp. GOD-11R]
MRKRTPACGVPVWQDIGRAVVMIGLASGLQIAHAASAAPICDVNGAVMNPTDKVAVQGRTGVMRCRDAVTGQVVREQDLQSGRFTGAVRYFTNGHLSREQFVNEKGNLQGRSREFAAGGQLLREGNYENGALNGLTRNFHPDGRLQRASFYGPAGELAYAEFTRRGDLRSLKCADRPVLAPAVDDARLCGFAPRPSQVSFVAESGALRARATFVAGSRVRYETFQDNGLPATQEETSANGRIERIFGADGTRRREVVWALVDGASQRDREMEFSSSGRLTRERRWSQGELSSEQTYYLNGQPRSKARYTSSGSVRTLETQDYYENGMLAAQGSYVDTGRYAPTPVGIHRQFDMQGRPKAESVYDTRGRLLRERSWDPAGVVLRDDEVLEDGSRRGPGPAAR